MLLCVGLLIFTGYSVMAAVVYALCRFFDVGVTHWNYNDDDWSRAVWLAFFWPVGVWVVLTVVLGKKLGTYADTLRVSYEQKRELVQKQKLVEKLEVEKAPRQLEQEMKEVEELPD
jgi:hypothetical protein